MRCFGRLKYQKNGPLASETGKETSPPAPAGFSRRVRALWRVSLPSGFFRCRADFGLGGRFFSGRFGRGACVPACRTGLRRPAGKVRDGLPLSRTACGADCARGVCRPERKVRRGRLNVSRTGGQLCPVLRYLRNRAADGRRFAVGISDARPVPEHAPVSGKRKGAKDRRSGTEAGPAAGRSDTAGSGSSGCRRNVFGDGCGAGVRTAGAEVSAGGF